MAPSPVAKLKCVKNSAEIEGMKLAQVILRTINYEIRNWDFLWPCIYGYNIQLRLITIIFGKNHALKLFSLNEETKAYYVLRICLFCIFQ